LGLHVLVVEAKPMTGRIAGIAIKPEHYAPMQEVAEARVGDSGIEGSAWATTVRRVTLLFAEQWTEVQRELGVEIPWLLRRANVLVSGVHPRDIMKRQIRLGEVELLIHGETKPCERMDEAHPGLRAALRPDLRGGVYGSVVQAGRIAVGDTVTVLDKS
jgi:MOSC domain-containing protein YiiM